MAKVSGVRKAIDYAMRTASGGSKNAWDWPTRQANLQIRNIEKRKHARRIGLALGGAGVGAGVIAYRSKGKN